MNQVNPPPLLSLSRKPEWATGVAKAISYGNGDLNPYYWVNATRIQRVTSKHFNYTIAQCMLGNLEIIEGHMDKPHFTFKNGYWHVASNRVSGCYCCATTVKQAWINWCES